ncbi:protein ACCELERATED CELL DEATH 6-like [Camellia sinensis]|uniref:PGG domain-containing protein n=1 Tax=Camellia sinensis var. sinensis TaxID=542762 RepID=A0A4S4ED51_CAMSN|nr:protein ACCELERATED CELL DEATH 6-like [Camellia sinensis]THG13656.1 hypothetical protein TEA_007395 [Camellia sinensis var. sinensis]
MSVPKFPGLLEEEEEEQGSYGTAESMDPELYRATTEGDILEFIQAMEQGPLDRQYGSSATCLQLGPQKNTVLHIATSSGRYEIVKLLCKDLPFFVAEKNAKGDTPLHIAARGGDSLLVSLLINSDFREEILEERNEEGNTALHEALHHRHEKVARILIDKNRNISYSVNKDGKSVVYLAAEGGYVGLVKILMENPAGNCSIEGRLRNKSPVHAAILGRNLDVLKILWEKDQSSFQLRFDEERRSALHCAASIGYLEGVNFLLSKCSGTTYEMDKHGLFPIHIASNKGHANIIQEMLHHCPDSRDLLTSRGQNIFHVAAKSGKAKAVSCMLKMPELAKLINERDDEGNTPLHIATINGHPRIVSTLTWDGRVNLELENNNRLTALDIAEEYMETMASFQKRLTWMALRVVGAPRAPHAKLSKTISSRVEEHSQKENYKDKVNVVLMVATLVTTVTFAAAFSIPGGYNNSDPNQGIATMLAKAKFQEFVICDTIAMYCSIIAVVILIWAQLGDVSTMHAALKLALPLLGIALAMMSIAFMAGVYLIVSKLSWLRNVVLLMGSNFVVTLAAIFVPLCFLGSSNYHIFRHVSYYPFLLMLYAFGGYTDGDDDMDE